MACSVDIIEVKRPKLQSSSSPCTNLTSRGSHTNSRALTWLWTTNDQWRSRISNLLWISVSATRLFWSLLWCLGCGIISACLTSKWLIAFSDFQRTIRPMVIKRASVFHDLYLSQHASLKHFNPKFYFLLYHVCPLQMVLVIWEIYLYWKLNN